MVKSGVQLPQAGHTIRPLSQNGHLLNGKRESLSQQRLHKTTIGPARPCQLLMSKQGVQAIPVAEYYLLPGLPVSLITEVLY